MGFSSQDDLIQEITTNGKFWRADWNKITGLGAYTAGRWYDTSNLNGTPVANAFSGSALTYYPTTDTSGFGIYHGGNVSPDTKHILNVSAVTAVATGVPGVLMLIDMQGYWPGINPNQTSTMTLSGTPSSTYRYANGAGLRCYIVPYSGTVGNVAHNINAFTYADQNGTTTTSLPVTVACTSSCITSHITHSGTAANNYGPFIPLASGDTGVQNVFTISFSAATTGSTPLYALVLAKPLLTIPITTASVLSERDLLNQLPSLPQVKDGACLTWLYFAGAATAANSNFYGAIEFGWG